MKLRAVHIRTNLQEDREVRSFNEVSKLADFGIEYAPRYSPKYKGVIPEPRQAGDRPFKLTPAHYGCYTAHRDAFNDYREDTDGLLMFECDALFSVPVEEMAQRIERAYKACLEGDLTVFTFGPKHDGKTIDTIGDDVIVITQFIETHAYLIPSTSYDYFTELFAKPWDALDYVYTIYMYDRDKKRIGTFKDRPVSFQAEGKSLIDGRNKNSEIHWKWAKYEN